MVKPILLSSGTLYYHFRQGGDLIWIVNEIEYDFVRTDVATGGMFWSGMYCLYQGPVVQSIVSLTSSLRGQLVKCFTTL